jgi:hypothetical protein
MSRTERDRSVRVDPLIIMSATMTDGLDFQVFLPHLAALLGAHVLALPIGWDREQEDRSAPCGPSR